MAGMVSVLIPPAADITNLVTNPSAETAVTGYTGVTNTATRQATYQRRGAWGVSYAMAAGTTDGLYYGTVSLTNAITYTFACDVRGALGIPYKIYFASTAGTLKGTATTFTGTGDWQRVAVSWACDSTTTYRVYVTKNSSADTSTIYVDGFAVVASSSEYRYFDGDSRGYRESDYYWTGTPHASTSVMRAGTRAGGVAVNLESYGFYITQLIGLGMAGLANIVIPTPLIGGGQYQRTNTETRQFALVGYVSGSSYQGLQQTRRSLINAFKPDAAPTQQPVTLVYQGSVDGTAFGDPLEIPALFDGGLEIGQTTGFVEQIALTFRSYLPYIGYEDGQEGVSLGYQTSVSNANYIIQRSASGTWAALGTGASGGTVLALAEGLDGTIYAGGGFTSMGGIANTAGIAKWDPAAGAWSALGSGGAASAIVRALVVGADGSIYAAGTFTSMGGVANTLNIAKWNGSAWSSVSSGLTGAAQDIYALAVGRDGALYAGGAFDTISGVASTAKIAKYTTSWAALGSGLGSATDVRSILVGGDNTVYAHGQGTMGSGSNFAKWDGSSWTAFTTNSHTGGASAFGSDGRIYASVTGSDSFRAFNGVAWTVLGSASANATWAAHNDPASGLILVATVGTATFNGVTFPGAVVAWNGSVYIPYGATMPSTGAARAFATSRAGVLYVGYTTSGTATVETVTTITNNGTGSAYPVIRLTGPGTVHSVKNYTTGDAIYFNLTLNSGEVAYLDLTPGAIRFWSNFRTNLLNTILAGSNLATFKLLSGANVVSLFVGGTTDANTAAWMYWRKPHHSIDGGAN